MRMQAAMCVVFWTLGFVSGVGTAWLAAPHGCITAPGGKGVNGGGDGGDAIICRYGYGPLLIGGGGGAR